MKGQIRRSSMGNRWQLKKAKARLTELVRKAREEVLLGEQLHLALLDEASKGWEDVERGRTLSVAKVRAKYNVAKKH